MVAGGGWVTTAIWAAAAVQVECLNDPSPILQSSFWRIRKDRRSCSSGRDHETLGVLDPCDISSATSSKQEWPMRLVRVAIIRRRISNGSVSMTVGDEEFMNSDVWLANLPNNTKYFKQKSGR